MEIDWITVSAQIVNFLVLVWLLKRFLYRPVINAMDRREQRIGERLTQAQERESLAAEKAQHFQRQREELDQRCDEFLRDAKDEAERAKKDMLDAARAEVAEVRAQWQQQVSQEKEEFLDNLMRQSVDATQRIARKALSELADAQLEEQIVNKFITQLKSLDNETQKGLSETAQPLRIATAFELDPSSRGRLTRAIHETIKEGIELDYTRSPRLLCGIELDSGERRISWNLAGFSEELTNRIDEAFSPAEPPRGRE